MASRIELTSLYNKLLMHYDTKPTPEKITQYQAIFEDWFRVLNGYSYPILANAFDMVLLKSKFMPKIADIIEALGAEKPTAPPRRPFAGYFEVLTRMVDWNYQKEFKSNGFLSAKTANREYNANKSIIDKITPQELETINEEREKYGLYPLRRGYLPEPESENEPTTIEKIKTTACAGVGQAASMHDAQYYELLKKEG